VQVVEVQVEADRQAAPSAAGRRFDQAPQVVGGVVEDLADAPRPAFVMRQGPAGEGQEGVGLCR
jgi:hypothetical protein